MIDVAVRKHSTAPRSFQLMQGNSPFVLTDKVVHIVLKKAAGVTEYNTTDDSDNMALLVAADGTVKFTPADGEWDADKRIIAYFWVEDGAIFTEFPSREDIHFVVRDTAAFDPSA